MLLGPAEPAPPDGFRVAAALRGPAGGAPHAAPGVRLASPDADVAPEAEADPSGLPTFRVRPRPGVREVRLEAEAAGRAASARVRLGPPAARVELALAPPAPVKGRDTEAVLTVRTFGPGGEPEAGGSPPVLRANVGALEGLEAAGPGVWRARYRLPATRYPEVAVLVALAPWPHPQAVHGALGALRVPLAAAVELPGTTEPNARMSIDIAGTTYGPVQAGRDGRFRLPVVVPPGVTTGRGTAVDRAGNTRRVPVDLRLPPTDGLACVLNPLRLPADGASRARLLCATSSARGEPVAEARVQASALHGRLEGPRRTPEGLLEWAYTAPRALPPRGEDALTAAWPERGPTSREVLALQVVQGPAAGLEAALAHTPAHRGSHVPLTARVLDAQGRPRAEAMLSARASAGAVEGLEPRADGEVRAAWSVPLEAAEGPAHLELEAWGPAGAEPARLVVWAEAQGALHAAVTDLAGLPVPTQPLTLDDAPRTTDARGRTALGALTPGVHVLRHARWPGLALALHVLEGGRAFPLGTAPAEARARLDAAVAPPVPVDVRVRVAGARVTYWAEDAEGRVLRGRELALHLTGVRAAAPAAEDAEGRWVLDVEGAGGVSVTDVATGVTALARVRP